MSFTFFDLESGPDAARCQQWLEIKSPAPEFKPMPAFDPKSVKIGNLKDKEKIAAKVDAAKIEHAKAKKGEHAAYEDMLVQRQLDAFAKGALEPRTAILKTFQFAQDDDKPEIWDGDGDEKALLKEIWKMFRAGSTWVNWTGMSDRANWDMNMLFRRSLAHNLYVPEDVYPTPQGYASSRILDLTPRFLAFEKWPAKAKLEHACIEFGIPLRYDGPVNGATFHEYWDGCRDCGFDKEQQRFEAEQYAVGDVYMLRDLFRILYWA